MREAEFYQKLSEGAVNCELCPHHCQIKEGKSGICGIRENQGGRLLLPEYGKITSLALDPIEKKPLYHFFPGEKVLSIGFKGCSFRCFFCQNWNISQEHQDIESFSIEIKDLISKTRNSGSLGIAYTYSEPLVHLEFLLDCATAFKEAGLKNIIVSNGFLNPEPAEKLIPLIDAINIDLKSFSEDFYRESAGGSLQPVKDFIKQVFEHKVHLEITSLIIPGKNDSAEEIEQIAGFIAQMDKNIALHLSAYRPAYKSEIPATSSRDLIALSERAREKLNFVYTGNLPIESNSYCPQCGELLVKRNVYHCSIKALKKGKCQSCGLDLSQIIIQE